MANPIHFVKCNTIFYGSKAFQGFNNLTLLSSETSEFPGKFIQIDLYASYVLDYATLCFSTITCGPWVEVFGVELMGSVPIWYKWLK